MFETLLIANRGEIACRIMRTARKMGIQTVAVYSEADSDAPHMQLADRAIPIGAAPIGESYLRGEKILAAAQSSGADAIHPGYGFLSENADFSEACETAGIRFVGPTADSIRAMGLKDEAKRRMEAAGVPVVPGEHAENLELGDLKAAAERIGYPLLVKAIAGGGGRGMRRVGRPEALEAALEEARREAESTFGDPRLLLERWLERSRHIEVQVFADDHGNAVHLFERDCSIQRRHQKILEEAPAPNLPAILRADLAEAALRATRAIDYRGAGTVEFIVDVSRGIDEAPFYFMEMNTRLQVEHPITEAITGEDLVEWQLRVAAGEALPRRQEELHIEGHAIEVRVYAEDASRRFLPQTGRLLRHRPPAEERGIRVDAGVAEGDEVGIHYDPMISKLIVHDRNRLRALERLHAALESYEIVGVTTNLAFLHAVSGHPAFRAAHFDTAFISDHDAALAAALARADDKLIALACVAILIERERSGFPQAGADPYSPWARTDSFRLNEDGFDRLRLRRARQKIEVSVHLSAEAITLEWENRAVVVRNPAIEGVHVSGILDGIACRALCVTSGEKIHMRMGVYGLLLEPLAEKIQTEETGSAGGSVHAPMPGKITGILVREGDRVERGQPLLLLEAMKMEYTLQAAISGTVEELSAVLDQQVEEGQPLLEVR